MIFYTDWAEIPLYFLVLGSLSILLILLHLTGPMLMLATKIFCLREYKVYRIYVLLKIVKWILTGVIIGGWVIYGR